LRWGLKRTCGWPFLCAFPITEFDRILFLNLTRSLYCPPYLHSLLGASPTTGLEPKARAEARLCGQPVRACSARHGARLYSARLEARAFGSGRLGLCPSLARSTWPLVFWWKDVDINNSTPSCSWRPIQNFDVNRTSLSDKIEAGSPWVA
jgi:hypothetical protein